MFCLNIFHGRNTPDEHLEDWGFDGPIIMNVGFAMTYHTLKVFEINPDGSWGQMLILPRHEDMVNIGGKFYADIELMLPTDQLVLETERPKLSFLELKQLVEANTK